MRGTGSVATLPSPPPHGGVGTVPTCPSVAFGIGDVTPCVREAYARGVGDGGAVYGAFRGGGNAGWFLGRPGGALQPLTAPGDGLLLYVSDMTAEGVAVGYASDPYSGEGRALVWEEQTPHVLPGRCEGGPCIAEAISDRRVIVGSVGTGTALRWHEGIPQELAVPWRGTWRAEATFVSETGLSAGSALRSDGVHRGVVWPPGQRRGLVTWQGSQSHNIAGLSQRGVVAGTWHDDRTAPTALHAYVWSLGSGVHSVPSVSSAQGATDAGAWGWMLSGGSTRAFFLSTDGDLTSLVPGLPEVIATGANDSGAVAGYCRLEHEGALQAFVWDGEDFATLPVAAHASRAEGVTASGIVYGTWERTADEGPHAFAWDTAGGGHSLVDLNDYLTDADSSEGWVLTRAYRASRSDCLAVQGVNVHDGRSHVFAAVPTARLA